MRNSFGGLVGAAVGCSIIVWLRPLIQHVYPEPFSMVWFLLSGSSMLQTTLVALLDWNTFMQYLVTWLAIGIAIVPFSKSNWNAMRTAVWVGLFVALFATASVLITNPSFWSSQSRNTDLIGLFSSCVIASLLSLISCVPIRMSAAWLVSGDAIPPEKIETICECGAVFKSRPMFCSECGRPLTLPDPKKTPAII